MVEEGHRPAPPIEQHDDTAARRFRRHLEGIIGTPATEGNRIDVLRNGDEIFPSMFEAVEAAERTIDFLTFVYWEGRIGEDLANRLCGRAKEGVRVRVLLDALGARTMDRRLLDDMDEADVDVRWFRPLHRFRPLDVNHRTHRKVLVVDEAIGFTGGVGIADEWAGDARDESEWRDTHFRVRGPVVDGLRAAFLDNWSETTPELFSDVDTFPEQPRAGTSVAQCVRGAAETGWSDVDILFRSLVQLAAERIRITTAYFVPDGELQRCLCDAADRGVEVEILLPGPKTDKRFVQLAGQGAYQRLMDHGIELWHFQPSMLHAKVMTVDGLVANIGSANLNARSVARDEEVNLVVFDADLIDELDRHFDEDLTRSLRMDPGRWRSRPLPQRVAELAMAPLRRQS